MIKEEYVSFETAKLLKEKGFDEITLMCYTSGGIIYLVNRISINTLSKLSIAAPTQQMAMRWLREEQELVIELNSVYTSYYNYIARIVFHGDTKKVIKYHNTYEDACEAAIKHCLKYLI